MWVQLIQHLWIKGNFLRGKKKKKGRKVDSTVAAENVQDFCGWSEGWNNMNALLCKQVNSSIMAAWHCVVNVCVTSFWFLRLTFATLCTFYLSVACLASFVNAIMFIVSCFWYYFLFSDLKKQFRLPYGEGWW